MQIDKIKSQIITPKTTGYASTACLANAVLSGISKNKAYRKTHKSSAYIGAIITAVHIAQIEYNHYKYKKSKQET